MSKKIILKQKIISEESMLAFGKRLAKNLEPGAIIYLYGPLGAGKTTLTRGILCGFGFKGKVKSPTYTLVESYHLSHQIIFHFDLYRLNHANELHDIGIAEYFTPSSICIIEWAEKGEGVLPCADLNCYIEFDGNERIITIEATSIRGEKMLVL